MKLSKKIRHLPCGGRGREGAGVRSAQYNSFSQSLWHIFQIRNYIFKSLVYFSKQFAKYNITIR